MSETSNTKAVLYSPGMVNPDTGDCGMLEAVDLAAAPKPPAVMRAVCAVREMDRTTLGMMLGAR